MASSPPSGSSGATPTDKAGNSPSEPLPNVASACPVEKLNYERCFGQWFTEQYLKGDAKEMGCNAEFEVYRKCVVKKMEERGFGDLVKTPDIFNQTTPIPDFANPPK